MDRNEAILGLSAQCIELAAQCMQRVKNYSGGEAIPASVRVFFTMALAALDNPPANNPPRGPLVFCQPCGMAHGHPTC